jgi:hypothetical protein
MDNLQEYAITLWTIENVQKYFRCGRNKALVLMRSKTFPSFKIGRKYYVAEKDVYRWVEKIKNHNVLL